MRELGWTEPALADLVRISAYLEREARPEIALNILTAIRHRANMLVDFPHAGPPVRDRGFRSLRVHGTPYIIAYRLDVGTLEILRVHHERENWRVAE
jgi:toxin ParE1/3/4